MYTRNEPRACALHVLVPCTGDDRPDPTALLAALGDRVSRLSVLVARDGGGHVPLCTLHRAADLVDDLAARTGAPVHYLEHDGDLADLLQRDHDRGVHPLVVLSAGAPRRTVRAYRRAAGRGSAHLAVVPRSTAPSEDRP